jgi:hypothetical protein
MCKPVIPVCGHPSCFWCVHRAMDSFGVSACPTCRHSFEHLPDVCVPLHRFLARAFPKQYARRLRETHEEEESNETFSPDPGLAMELRSMRVGVDDDENTDDENTEERHTSTDENTEQDIRTDENTEEQHVSYATFRALERVTPVALPNDQSLKHLFQCGFHGPSASTENEQEQEQEQEAHTLQRPVVLTCGHAVCEACAAARLDFGGAKQKGLGIIESDRHRAHCPKCDARVVGTSAPAVCLPLHNVTHLFVDEDDVLTRADATRSAAASARATARSREIHRSRQETGDATCVGDEDKDAGDGGDKNASRDGQHDDDDDREEEHGSEELHGSLADTFLQVTGNTDPAAFCHYGVGCDSCGVYPIRGRRWRCADCPEAIGFDLCGMCVVLGETDNGSDTGQGETDTSDPGDATDPESIKAARVQRTHRKPAIKGRFNQNHLSTHVMIEVQPTPTMMHGACFLTVTHTASLIGPITDYSSLFTHTHHDRLTLSFSQSVLTQMHPELTPAMIVDFANQNEHLLPDIGGGGPAPPG